MRGRIGRRGDRCGREISEWAKSYNYVSASLKLAIRRPTYFHNPDDRYRTYLVEQLHMTCAGRLDGASGQDYIIGRLLGVPKLH